MKQSIATCTVSVALVFCTYVCDMCGICTSMSTNLQETMLSCWRRCFVLATRLFLLRETASLSPCHSTVSSNTHWTFTVAACDTLCGRRARASAPCRRGRLGIAKTICAGIYFDAGYYVMQNVRVTIVDVHKIDCETDAGCLCFGIDVEVRNRFCKLLTFIGGTWLLLKKTFNAEIKVRTHYFNMGITISTVIPLLE